MRQGAFPAKPFASTGVVHVLRAASFVRRLISAYRFVVSRLTWPSQPRMTLSSTPASSRWTAGTVAHHVRCDAPAAYRGVFVQECRVSADDLVDTEPRQGAATLRAEDGILRRGGVVTGDELLQARGGFRPDGTRAPLVALSVQTHARPVQKLQMPDAEVRGLLDARAGVVQHEEERAIAFSGPRTGREAGKEGFHLAAVHVTGLRRRYAFGGHAEDPLRGRHALRHPIADVRKEGAQHRQPMVSRAHVIVSIRFERPEEGQDAVGGQGAQGERNHGPADVLRDKAQEEPHPVAIARDGRRTESLRHRQIVDEERMENLPERERRHGRLPVRSGRASCSNRLLASARRSAVIVR